ncbi:NAC domain [Macleaya cordata]|uniref:NAC domain n=1 Tax=Macleaya cordata TaxID=56857 RepID=A0A200R3X5_MACCD|nr:NAC domain [Macleaya cordata]
MEKLNFVKNGVIRLPPGFRFHPTDEELVQQYLKRKVFACPLPASIIPELNVCKYDPWNLPGDSEQERYFFSTREAKYPNGNRPNRATGSGYWKATGIDKKIVAFRSNQVVGMKKTLVFYRGKPPNGTRTDWIMHEYRLVDIGTTTSNILQRKINSSQNHMMQIGDWVLCRIFLKKRNNKKDDEIDEPCKENRVTNHLGVGRPRFIDFMMQEKIDLSSSPSSSSSCSSSASSGITEVSSTVSDHEENSYCNSET